MNEPTIDEQIADLQEPVSQLYPLKGRIRKAILASLEKLAALESQPDAPVGFIVRGNSSGDVWFEWAQNSLVNSLDQLIPLGKSAPVFLRPTKPEVKSLEKHCSFHGGYGLKKNCIDCNAAIESQPVPVEPERVKAMRSDTWCGGDVSEALRYIDSLQSALQRAQEERDESIKREKSKHDQYSALLERHTKLAEKFTQAESLNRRMVELLKEPSANMLAAGAEAVIPTAGIDDINLATEAAKIVLMRQNTGHAELRMLAATLATMPPFFRAMSAELLKEVEK